MKTVILSILIFISLIFRNQEAFSQINPERVYTQQELQQDFMVLRNKFETKLANLYLYTPKSTLDKIFDSLYLNIGPMTEIEFYNYITPLLSVIKDGHSIILPSPQTITYHKQNSGYFPFQVYIDEGKFFIVENYSDDSTFYAGTEILSINNTNADLILQDMNSKQVRDGYNTTFPAWIYNHYFRSYYNLFYGYSDFYFLKIKNTDGSIAFQEVKAVSQDSLIARRKNRYPSSIENNSGKGIYLEIKNNTAVLTIKSWDRTQLKKVYNQKFKKEIDEIFSALHQKQINYLVIDLRDNQGGSMNYGDYLLGYLLNNNYQYAALIEKVKSHGDTSQILKSINGKFLKIHEPQKQNYQGAIYVLINGGSFSNSGIFCSGLDAYQRAVFIGEETGGNNTVLTGVFRVGRKTVLPNTKIVCDKADNRIIISDLKNNTGHGVMPDYRIVPNINDMIAKKDVVMEFVLDLISQTIETDDH